ncbi:xanthine dehydrogenase family protein molybdopterin-binding subunit [Pseudohoeflea coraliihabitans]|uniref:Xanthine dehydrogenase family protein molybdopterin-binding subunit n=1 Tax=Pseudohoeflea coraliihabitans TaxID=2860393 RepID=A0ABS6WN92_9HYPH|nr:xanthine dehydrogenase family protein molybdopterin-binding subunit [Pseudohoeflea sp. DP4N28-3]MBW3097421.1 xanthine dehydrogenase family protein molybdopterin-binding subunit [Pseudohoeflea sp. DP4N28-3]
MNDVSSQRGVDSIPSKISRPKYIGEPVQRLEDPRLLTGAGRFTSDIRLERMVHLAFVRSDQAHAKISEIDFGDALEMPGVLAIYTAGDFTDIPDISAPSRMKNYHATHCPVLARDVVRYVGEPVAVVVATDRYLAEDAATSIVVEYEPLGASSNVDGALAAGAVQLHDDVPGNLVLERVFATGEAPEQIAAASHVVEGRFRLKRKSPLAMENRAYVVDYDRGRDALTLYGSTQIPGVVRDELSRLLGMPGNRIRVVAPDVGGGFGGKGSIYPEEILVVAIARRLARPVKYVSDRLEDLTSTSQGFDEVVKARLAFDDDGTFIALEAEVIGDIGAYSIYPWTAALEPVQVASFLPGPYRTPHYWGRVRAVCTPKPPTGPYRGVGRPMAVFALERLVDKAAAHLGMDRAEIRRRNLVRPEEFPHRIGSGIIWNRSGFMECLEAAVETIDYAGFKKRQEAARKEGRWIGQGIGTYAELTGIGSRIAVAPGMPINTGSETATVRIDATGAVVAMFATASHGQSLETTLAQIVAEELGVRPEDVQIMQGDTAVAVHGTGTYASRSAVIGGGAAIKSTRSLLTKVKRVAGRLFDVDPDRVETGDGEIFVPGTNHRIRFADLARAVYSDMATLPLDARETLESQESFDPYLGTTTSSTHIAEVEIDPETLAIRLTRFVVAEDCGKMINPQVVDGQVHGGVAQGVGVALLEELQYDETGQLLSASLADYLIPTSAEVPHIEVIHLETELPDNPGGFRGMGEGGTIGAPAAIANAVADALAHLDLDITELPITPSKLHRLIVDKRATKDME